MSSGRYAITFGDVCTSFIGGHETGTKLKNGLSVSQLCQIGEKYGGEYISLATEQYPETQKKENEAGILILRNGVNKLIENGTEKMLKEQQECVVWDRTSFDCNKHKYVMKRSRYNTVFANEGKEQNVTGFIYKEEMTKEERMNKLKEEKEDGNESCSFGKHTLQGGVFTDSKKAIFNKQYNVNDAIFAKKNFVLDTTNEDFVEATINAFADLPMMQKMRKVLGSIVGVAKDLNAEGNFYEVNTKSQIGYHGDTERTVVICVCLGLKGKLTYAWRAPNSSENLAERSFVLNSGDIYFMSEKAAGGDWKKRKLWRMVHKAESETNKKKRKLK